MSQAVSSPTTAVTPVADDTLEQDHYRTAGVTYEELARARMAAITPDADLDATTMIMVLLRTANLIVRNVETKVHRPLGWSWPGFRVMFAVLVAGPAAPNELAKITGFTRASISAVLNTLERDGLVRRNRRGPDRRSVSVELTTIGKRAVLEGFEAQNRAEQAWASLLTAEERDVLITLLRRLLHGHPGLNLENDEGE